MPRIDDEIAELESSKDFRGLYSKVKALNDLDDQKKLMLAKSIHETSITDIIEIEQTLEMLEAIKVEDLQIGKFHLMGLLEWQKETGGILNFDSLRSYEIGEKYSPEKVNLLRAKEYLTKALDINDWKSNELKRDLGVIYFDNCEYEHAIAMLKDTYRHPLRDDYLYCLYKSYLLDFKSGDARDLMQLEIDPDNFRLDHYTLLDYIEILEESNRIDIEYLQEEIRAELISLPFKANAIANLVKDYLHRKFDKYIDDLRDR